MITIIVPVYKVEPYLRQCIESILCQTYRDIEILLIDDGSPDRCGEICDYYAKIDSRINVFHTENRGLSAARNVGLDNASGEYIGFVDGDDWIDPTMYEGLVETLHDADISTCGLWYEYQGYQREWRYSKDTVFIGEALQALIYGKLKNTVWNKLYRRKCWEGIRFPEGHVHEDIATTYKILLRDYTVATMPACLYHYRQRDGSIAKTRSMDHIKDYWSAFHNRYLDLRLVQDIKDDANLMDRLLRDVASAAVKTWYWTYGVTKEERDYPFLKLVSEFVHANIKTFGEKSWGKKLCLSIFLVRFVNDVAFSISYIINKGYRQLVNNRSF